MAACGLNKTWQKGLLALTVGMAFVSVVLVIRLFCDNAFRARTAEERRARMMSRFRPTTCISCTTLRAAHGIYVGGIYSEPRDFDPDDGIDIVGDTDYVVVAFDTAGELRWSCSFARVRADRPSCLFMDDSSVYAQFSSSKNPRVSGHRHTDSSIPNDTCGSQIIRMHLKGGIDWVKSAGAIGRDSTYEWMWHRAVL